MPERYRVVPDQETNAIFDEEKGKIIAWIASDQRAKEIVKKLNKADKGEYDGRNSSPIKNT